MRFFLFVLIPLALTALIDSPGSPPTGEDPAAAAGGTEREKEATPPAKRKPVRLPLELDREHRYAWILDRSRVGESKVRLTEVSAPEGSEWEKIYLCHAEYRYETEGNTIIGHHDLYLDPSWRPLHFKAYQKVNTVTNGTSENRWEGKIEGEKLSILSTDNGIKQLFPTVMDAPSGGYLWLNPNAVENFGIMASNVLLRPSTYDAIVIYPTLNRVATITFLFEKQEEIDVGGKEKLPCNMFAFSARNYSLKGQVWMDPKGRMVKLKQGRLTVLLEE